ncbi:MAG: hypothetical protein JSW39_13200 [Desulfobacterales bacterium]|nr:MAG: hypothetical protein JSW39_13200 [Desulfobacterales bacterium]
MNGFKALTMLIFLVSWSVVEVDASWLIDAERYHVAVHGQLSCQDCHTGIAAKQLHPQPTEVNKTLPDFFRLEQCTQCHGEVLNEIDNGAHGGEKVADREKSNFCIACHDPHYQASYSASAAKVDLDQPAEVKCSLCHEFQTDLPEPSPEDEQCLGCHRSFSPSDPQAGEKISHLCFHCHGSAAQGDAIRGSVRYPLIDVPRYGSSTHAGVACLVCHLRSAEFKHAEQELADCRQCHRPHDEKVAHDAHFGITCEACHLEGVIPVKDPEAGQLRWRKERPPGRPSGIHHIVTSKDDSFCRRCHFRGNTFGAAAMVLPAKSVICMPCHVATFSVGDTTTIVALVIFLGGVLGGVSVWFSGNLGGGNAAGFAGKIVQTLSDVYGTLFSPRIIAIGRALILDALLQRRLFRISKARWLNHALVFFPILLRLAWGLVALVTSLGWPQWPGVRLLLDKNHPLPAFVFDVTGVMVILGVVGMVLRRQRSGATPPLQGLPRADWAAYSLLGGIFMLGFVLEGLRIAMSDRPEGAVYAFLGYFISRLFSGADLTGIYGYLWYAHAITIGTFVAYLPFSRMFHMVMAPVTLALNADRQHHRNSKNQGRRTINGNSRI